MPDPSSEPLVSVIMPTHNRATLLPRAIRSVLGQTYRNLELIVVDDASTDDTAQVVAQFDDPRLRYLRQERNSRAAAARNRGIREARGEFLAFQDDDDEWLPIKLERQVAALRHAPPEVGLHLAGFHRVEDAGTTYFGGERYVRALDFERYFLDNDHSLISTPNWLLRRAVLERAGVFDERFKSLDDWELAIRILDACRLQHLDEPLWLQHRRRSEGAGMALNDRLMLQDYPLLLEKYGTRWRRSVRAKYCFHTAKMHVLVGQPRDGLAWLRRSLMLNPFSIKAWALLLAFPAGGRPMRGMIWLWRRTYSLAKGLAGWVRSLFDRRPPSARRPGERVREVSSHE